jgi:hypothetical protein
MTRMARETPDAKRLTMRNKGFWRRLKKWERARLMQLQMSKSGSYGGGGYLPDDCSECGACGQPMFGSGGMCHACYREYEALMAKGSQR